MMRNSILDFTERYCLVKTIPSKAFVLLVASLGWSMGWVDLAGAKICTQAEIDRYVKELEKPCSDQFEKAADCSNPEAVSTCVDHRGLNHPTNTTVRLNAASI